MKDYSKLLQNPYGFITKYEIVGNELHVYTAESVKGEPHKFPANKEWIASIEKRLENQYSTLVKNKDVFKKEFLEKGNKKLNIATLIVSGVLLSASGILLAFELGLISLAALGFLIIVIGGNRIIISKREADFSNEIVIIESYLENRTLIDSASKLDSNVTSYLSADTTKRIKENRELENRQLIDSTFNIDFMDKTSLKDLRKMLKRYYISDALRNDQVFVVANDNEDTKKRSRKKDK